MTGPLYGDMEVLDRTPAALAAYLQQLLPQPAPAQRDVLPDGTVRLEAPEQSISPELEEAFLQGTLGGAAAGAGGRSAALIPYELGARGAQEALDLATNTRLGHWMPSQAASDALEWSRTGYASMPEEVKAARGDYLRRYEEMFPGSTEQYYGVGSDRPGGYSRDLKMRGILPDRNPGAASRTPEAFDARTYGPGERSSRVFREALWDQTVGDAQRSYALRDAEEAADVIRKVAAKRDLAKHMVRTGVKGAVNPVSIAADAFLGGTVGLGAAAFGHEAGGGDRESAGLFTPPGEGYEGLVRAEDIERVIAQKQLEKEAERQRLLEQYRASGYDLDPNTRLRDLR